jgi:hypothetical protein
MDYLKIRKTECEELKRGKKCGGEREDVLFHSHETERKYDYTIGSWCEQCRNGYKIDPNFDRNLMRGKMLSL